MCVGEGQTVIVSDVFDSENWYSKFDMIRVLRVQRTMTLLVCMRVREYVNEYVSECVCVSVVGL